MILLKLRQRALNARCMRQFSSAKLFTPSHEWIQESGNNVVRVGISHFAQDQLGEIVYCDLPSAGSSLLKGQTLCTLESVKAVGEVYAPVAGEIVEVNGALESTPNLVNQDPEDAGWLVKIRYNGDFAKVCSGLKDAVAYKETLETH